MLQRPEVTKWEKREVDWWLYWLNSGLEQPLPWLRAAVSWEVDTNQEKGYCLHDPYLVLFPGVPWELW